MATAMATAGSFLGTAYLAAAYAASPKGAMLPKMVALPSMKAQA
jgi:hypothetical protein